MGDSPEARLERLVNATLKPLFKIRFLGDPDVQRGRVQWSTKREREGVFTTELPCKSARYAVEVVHDERKHTLVLRLKEGGRERAAVTFKHDGTRTVQINGPGNKATALQDIAEHVDTNRYWSRSGRRWWISGDARR